MTSNALTYADALEAFALTNHVPVEQRVILTPGIDTEPAPRPAPGPWDGLTITEPDAGWRDLPQDSPEYAAAAHLAAEADEMRRAVGRASWYADRLSAAMWHAPSGTGGPDGSMTTEQVLAWRRLPAAERQAASFDRWTTSSPRGDADDAMYCRFTARWAAYWSTRGVPAYDAACDGARTVADGADLFRCMPGSAPGQRGSVWTDAMIIPRRSILADANGEQAATGYQARPGAGQARNADGKAIKAVTPVGMRSDLHCPSRTRWLIEQAGGVHLHDDMTLVLTEGAAEAMAIAASGIPAMSAPGVWGFHNIVRDPESDEPLVDDQDRKVRVLVPTLRYLLQAWQRAGVTHRVRVVAMFDHDLATNDQVRAAGEWLVRQLRPYGVTAELWFSPALPDDDHAGPGDYLATGRTWDDLMAEAEQAPTGSRAATVDVVGPVVSGTVVDVSRVDWRDPREVAKVPRQAIQWDRVPGGREAWHLPSVTDAGLARWWADRMGERFLVTELDGQTYVYDGVTFKRQHTGKAFSRAASEFVTVAAKMADAAMGPYTTTTEIPDTRDDAAKGATRKVEEEHWPSEALIAYEFGSKHKYLASFMQASESLSVPATALDANGELLVFDDCTYDHRTGDLRANDPRDRVTMSMGCAYDPDARHDLWESVLDTWGGRDAPLARYMQLVLGESLLRRLPSDYKMRMIIGEPDSAKSFAFTALMECFPGLVGLLPKVVLSGDIADNSTQFAMADLSGRGLLFCEEMEESNRLHVNTIKELHSGSSIKARRPGGEWYEARPTWSMWALVNNLPTLVGKVDESVAKRIEVIPMPYRYTMRPTQPHHRQMDPTIRQRMRASIDQVRPAAAAWLIEGLRRLRDEYADNLYGKAAAPAEVVKATTSYLEGSDSFATFIRSSLQAGTWSASDPDGVRFDATTEDLWEAYLAWRIREYGQADRGRAAQRTLLDRLRSHPLFLAHGIEDRRVRPLGGAQVRRWTGVRVAVAGYTGTGYGWDAEADQDGELLTPTAQQVRDHQARVERRRKADQDY